MGLPIDVILFFGYPKYPLVAESNSNNGVRCYQAGLRLLWVFPVLICGWNTMPGHKWNKMGWCRPSITCFSIFWSIPNTHSKQNLKVIIVLGVLMLVLGSCEWLLWSYVGELLCLDTNKTGCVDLDLPSVVLVFSEAPQVPTCRRI